MLFSQLRFARSSTPSSGDCKSRRVALSGAVASVVVAVPRVTRRVTGRCMRALGMIRLCVCGDAGLANARGYAEALRFADQHAAGARVWTIEGAGHYGAGLARSLSSRGETVLEAGRS